MSSASTYKTRTLAALVLTATLLPMVGCVSFKGIDHQGQALHAESLATPVEYAAWPAGDWWKVYADPVLDDLITRAVANNPSVQIAVARVAKSHAMTAFSRSSLLPQVTAGFDSNYQRFSEHGYFPPPIGGSHDSDNRFAVDANYELDFFGKHRAAVAAATSQAAAAEADAQAARIAIAAEVARAYFELARLEAQRTVAEATRTQREAILKLVRARVAEGLDSNVQLRQAEGALPEIRAEIEQINERIDLTRNVLATLAATGHESTSTLAPALANAPDVPLPADIPSDLLARRADVTAARWRVEAATRNIDVAKAEFYPSVNLAAFAGFTSLGLSVLLESGARSYGIRPVVRLPIFDAGRLRANLKSSNADLDAALADYNQSLLAALQDVVSTLTSSRSLRRQMAEQHAAQLAAESAYELAMQRYRIGLTDYLTVLSTENAVLQQHRAAVDLKARSLALHVNLNQALGGGFDPDALVARN